MSKKVIIFTYYWPPAGGIAVQRFLKFTKYLPLFGWEPIIITVENGSYPYYDESLIKEVSTDLRVYRTKTFEPFEIYNWLRGTKGKIVPQAVIDSSGRKSLFQKLSEYIRANYFIPDARKGWRRYAVKQALEILKTEKIDAIITTGPPHSAHLIGLELKQKYGLKWVADFRDPWTGIFYNKKLPRSENAVKKDIQMESAVLANCDRVTVIGPGMKEAFKGKSDKIDIVYNGFDEEDFNRTVVQTPVQNKFIIRYVGNLIGSQNIPALWSGLAKLKSKLSNELIFEVIGRADEEVVRYIHLLGLGDIVSYSGFIGHKEAMQLMQQAGLLVLIIPDVPDNSLIITGKLFEYIGSGTQILGIGPVSGDAANVLNMAGRKAMNAYNDEAGITAQIEEAYIYWKNNGHAYKYSPDDDKIFTRRKQAEDLANILNSITS